LVTSKAPVTERLTKEEAQALVEGMLDVVRGWSEFFMQQGVEPRSIDKGAADILQKRFAPMAA